MKIVEHIIFYLAVVKNTVEIQALERECKEELGSEAEIGDLLFVREYIGENHELAAYHSHAH